MKRKLALLIAAGTILATLFSGGSAFAVDPLDGACTTTPDSPACQRSGTDANGNPLNPLTGEGGAIMRIASIIAILTGIASVIFIIVGSIKYTTAGGDARNIESAKNTVMYALIGLVVAISAQAIIAFVINRTN